MIKILLLTFLVTVLNGAPQLISLNRFSSVATSVVKGVENGARLYLASADDNSVLRNINITSGAGSITLDKLNDYHDDGTPKYFVLIGDLWVTTSNNDTTMAAVTGNIYITSKTQADDPNFSVYVIKDQHYISTNAMKSTVVVLNTWQSKAGNSAAPTKTSYVTGMNQSPNTNIYFQWGIPSADWYADTNVTFFRNPVVLTNENLTEQVFFDYVEPLQIGLDSWYFLVMGPNSMKIEKKYVNTATYATTAVKTTGLVMNNGIYQDHVVNFMPDTTRGGKCGGYFSSCGKTRGVGVYMQSGHGSVSSTGNYSNEDHFMFYTYDQANQLTVNTTTNTPGTFFVQYFTFPGLPKSDTTAQTTMMTQTLPSSTYAGGVSTTTVGTSTKRSESVLGVWWLIMVMMVVRLI